MRLFGNIKKLMHLVLCISFLILHDSQLLQAQAKFPDTPAGKRLQESLEVINSQDYRAIRTYIIENYTKDFVDYFGIDFVLNFYLGLSETSHGFEFHGMRKSEEFNNTGIFKSKLTGLWLDFGFKVQDEPPHKIKGMNIRPYGPPGESLPRKMSDEEIAREIKGLLEKLSGIEAFSGAVLFAKNGEVLFKGAYGKASRRFNAPNRTDTKFNLASMSKYFTAVAIAQLVEKGKLLYEDYIGKYLDSDWISNDIGKKVKIWHLLTHSAGTGDFLENKEFTESSRLLYRSMDDYRVVTKDDTLRFEPGSKYAYSNSGYLLLGAIIEKVTGQSYFDYVQDNICTPAGMLSTGFYSMDEPVPNLAVGYYREYGEENVIIKNNVFLHAIRGVSAGGGYSTVEDLLKFVMALRTNKLVSEETTNRLLTVEPVFESSQINKYGFYVFERDSERYVGASGGFEGIRTAMRFYLDSGHTFIVLENLTQPFSPVVNRILELLDPSYFRSR
ncbi:MAG: beta-lactamase family protein [bacterium]|nr:MAG: beta-lactamase family protein [bacterium]